MPDISGKAGKCLSFQVGITHAVETIGAGDDMVAQNRLERGMVRRRDRPADERRSCEENSEACHHGTARKPAVLIIWCRVFAHVPAHVRQKRGNVRTLTAN